MEGSKEKKGERQGEEFVKGGEEGEQKGLKAHVCLEYVMNRFHVQCTCTVHVQHPIYQHTHMNNEAHCIAHYTGRREERRDSNKEYTCTVQCAYGQTRWTGASWADSGQLFRAAGHLQYHCMHKLLPSNQSRHPMVSPVTVVCIVHEHVALFFYFSKPLRLLEMYIFLSQ